MAGRDFEQANSASRARLEALVRSLSAPDLAVDLGGGWTVAAALAHLAFWDRFQAARWRAALDAGALAPAGYPEQPLDDFVNVGLDGLYELVVPEGAARAVVAAATELDALLATLPDEAVATAHALGVGITFDRSAHRLEHVGQIERGLGRG